MIGGDRRDFDPFEDTESTAMLTLQMEVTRSSRVDQVP